MRSRKRNLAPVGVAAFALAGAAVAAWLVWAREPTLAEKAQRIAPLDTSHLPQSLLPRERAYWLSPSELLIDTNDQDRPIMTGWRGHLDAFNLRTHNRCRLTGVTDQLRRLPLQLEPTVFLASPDGQWLYWASDFAGYVLDAGVVSRDGSRHRRWRPASSPAFWLDNRRVVEFAPMGSGPAPYLADVHDVLDPSADRCHSVATGAGAVILAAYKKQQPGDAFNGLPRPYEARDGNPVQGAEPNDIDCMSSPRGDAIVYHLTVRHVPPMMARLNRIIPAIPASAVMREELWIQHIGDHAPRLIGYVPASKTDDVRLQNLAFSPDGKQMSFVYQGMLYVTSTEVPK